MRAGIVIVEPIILANCIVNSNVNPNTSSTFPLCLQQSLSVTHALSCPHGAFPIIYHNDVHNLTAKLLSEVCHNVPS